MIAYGESEGWTFRSKVIFCIIVHFSSKKYLFLETIEEEVF